MTISKLARQIRAQLILCIAVGLIWALGRLGILPAPDDLQSRVIQTVANGGPALLGLISFVENIGGLNFYFPGSVAILASMASAAGEPMRAMLLFVAITLASFMAHQLNFLGGRLLADHRHTFSSTSGVEGKLIVAFLVSFGHPHLFAIAVIAAGSEGVPYRMFLSHFSPIFLLWNIFWGVAMYSVGTLAPQDRWLLPLFWSYLFIWTAWDILKVTRPKT